VIGRALLALSRPAQQSLRSAGVVIDLTCRLTWSWGTRAGRVEHEPLDGGIHGVRERQAGSEAQQRTGSQTEQASAHTYGFQSPPGRGYLPAGSAVKLASGPAEPSAKPRRSQQGTPRCALRPCDEL